jgi:hypothetical protein
LCDDGRDLADDRELRTKKQNHETKESVKGVKKWIEFKMCFLQKLGQKRNRGKKTSERESKSTEKAKKASLIREKE